MATISAKRRQRGSRVTWQIRPRNGQQPGSRHNLQVEGNILVADMVRRQVFPRGISADHASHGECTVNWREPAASAQVYRAVQRTVVPGNWKGGRQSDSSIVLMMKSNAFGRKGTVGGNILGGNLFGYSVIRKSRKTNFEKKTDGYTEIRQMIRHLGSPVRESRTPGSTGGVPRKGHVYQPKLHAGFRGGQVS